MGNKFCGKKKKILSDEERQQLFQQINEKKEQSSEPKVTSNPENRVITNEEFYLAINQIKNQLKNKKKQKKSKKENQREEQPQYFYRYYFIGDKDHKVKEKISISDYYQEEASSEYVQNLVKKMIDTQIKEFEGSS